VASPADNKMTSAARTLARFAAPLTCDEIPARGALAKLESLETQATVTLLLD
jgi:hypothetical protein